MSLLTRALENGEHGFSVESFFSETVSRKFFTLEVVFPNRREMH